MAVIAFQVFLVIWCQEGQEILLLVSENPKSQNSLLESTILLPLSTVHHCSFLQSPPGFS